MHIVPGLLEDVVLAQSVQKSRKETFFVSTLMISQTFSATTISMFWILISFIVMLNKWKVANLY